MKRHVASGVVLGIFIILAGCLALLNSLFHIKLNIGFWGFLGIIVAALSIISFIKSGLRFGNICWFFIGSWMFIGNLGWLGENSFATFIAILLIAIGVWIITNAVINQRSRVRWTEFDDNGKPTDTDDYIKYETSFSDSNISNSSKSFKGGRVTASFGHIRLDLSNIEIQGEARVQVDASFGEIEIAMPRNMPYKTSVSPFLGSFENHAPIVPVTAGQPYLEITGTTSFGSVKLY